MAWGKIELENAIFDRAGILGESVDGVAGELRSTGTDGCLQGWVRIYNVFFSKENRIFLKDTGELAETFWKGFRKQQIYPSIPLLQKGKIPFFKIDFETELFLSRD